MRRASTSLSVLPFFGLTLQYRKALFQQLHEIVFYGKGGYDWHTIYNMPIWLRRFTFNEIKNYYDEEKKSYENSKSNSSSLPYCPVSAGVNFLNQISHMEEINNISINIIHFLL